MPRGGECMGVYFNPGNRGFAEILNGDYQDKTGMIGFINDRIGTSNKLVCISRPRRFGKSYAAQMLCAYYDCTCNSKGLFDNLEISKAESHGTHMNQYNVLYLDLSSILSIMTRKKIELKDISRFIASEIREELVESYPSLERYDDVSKCIKACVKETKKQFVFIIDEWDAVIREAKDDTDTQEAYLDLLREWFKGGQYTSQVVAAAYMTGILPIKKDGSESAVSDFDEYSVLAAEEYAPYAGFTEDEVEKLCQKYGMDFYTAKEWYDGYVFGNCQSVYNPYSVMQAMKRKAFRSYWRKTSTAESLKTYVGMNMDELQDKIMRLIAGEPVEVYTDEFENDFETFNSSDDVLTLMIHLGYLAYDVETSMARIPNEELRIEFKRLLNRPSNKRLADLVRDSEKLLKDTLNGNETAVVESIKKVRDTNYAPMYYNNEQSLRYVIKFAYIVCVDYYLKVEELPSGHGIADVVFIPKRDTALPAMIVELKWNEAADGAIEQIKNRNYPAVLNGYGGELVLVGINYDQKTKDHSCKIERIYIE